MRQNKQSCPKHFRFGQLEFRLFEEPVVRFELTAWRLRNTGTGVRHRPRLSMIVQYF
jgi:hypothetical protein